MVPLSGQFVPLVGLLKLDLVPEVIYRVPEDLSLCKEVENVHLQVALCLDAVVAHRQHLVLVHPQFVADF